MPLTVERSTSGMPLLSGPAPPPHDSSYADISCRKCNKEFNIIFTRARKCNHCGYSYCSSCSDYQALMPREGFGAGYDPVPVCAFCIENLTITAGGRNYLRNLSLARLKKYVDAYSIKTEGVLEKDDLIARIIAARGQNGCLPYANESFYRRHSVPNGRTGRPRGLFSRRDEPQSSPPAPPRQPPSSNTTSSFPRPDLGEDQQRASPAPRRTTPRPQAQPQPQPSARAQPYPPPRSTPPPTAAPRPQYSPPSGPPPSRPNTAHPTSGQGTAPGPGSSPAPRATRGLAPVDRTLKGVLYHHHVNARLLLEKSDLVARVHALLDDERHERAREAAIHAREEEEAIARQHAMMEEQRVREERARQEREDAAGAAEADRAAKQQAPTPAAPAAKGTALDLERNGLCVICQDEEANIAIVDCGHLAMCRNCSDLIMASSRECPFITHASPLPQAWGCPPWGAVSRCGVGVAAVAIGP
ncbi:hypothetical protein BC834DRAFT_1028181 [Gloeopeniophorella convolvens]|nr:hypothetical protein BC834DRAFT_1028181 [Gloeopeniophorella convolvens]